MLHSLSWSNYLGAVAVVLVVYYGWLAATYYRDEISAFIKAKRQSKATADQDTENIQESADFDKLEDIVHEINSILDTAGTGSTKDQLLTGLKLKLASYDGLGIPAYRVAVFNHIIAHAEETCGVRISVDELEKGI